MRRRTVAVVLDSGEGDIVGGIKLGTHTGRLCDPGGTISASASCRVHQKVRGITHSLFFLATRILLWSWGEWSGIPSVSFCMTKGNVFHVAFEKTRDIPLYARGTMMI